MRVVIEVIEGASKGKKHWLATGQALIFGRTHRADVVFGDDAQMSSRHLELRAEGTACQLTDLESTNGTALNEEFVKSAVLADGDIITAGGTKLLVNFVYNEGEVPTTEFDSSETTRPNKVDAEDEGSDQSNAEPITVVPLTQPRQAIPDSAHARSTSTPSFSKEPCMSGLAMFRGALFGEDENEPVGPSDLAVILARKLTPYWIIDFSKLDVPKPDGISGRPLFDWLPAEVAEEHSPILIGPDQSPIVVSMLDDAWDCDGVISFWASGDPSEELIDHLVSAMYFNIRGQAPTDGEPKAMLGYCWPSVLSQLLAFRTQEFVGNLLAGIEVVLLEMPDFPCTWQMFAAEEFAASLGELGFSEVSETAPPIA